MAFMLGTAASQLGLVQALAPLWTPADLAQPPAGWFDAMDESSFTTVGGFRGSYTVWTNKGYRGYQAQTTTDTGQPTRSASSASDNNKPAILLGSNPLTTDLGTDQGNLPSSIFAVARDNTGGEAIVASTGRATDATQDVRTLVIRNGTAAIDFAGGNRFQGTGPAVTVPQVVGFTVQTTGDQTTSVWANGTEGANGFRSSPTGARVTIGQMPYYTPNPPVQALQELLIFDYALSTTQRQLVEGYLAHRWGTIASLPAAHPYKSAAPRVATPVETTYRYFVPANDPGYWNADNALSTAGNFYSVAANTKVTGVQFFRASSSSGLVISLYRYRDQALLAQKTVTAPVGDGWVEELFDTPITISANEPYQVGLFSSNGFATSANGFYHPESDGARRKVGPLRQCYKVENVNGVDTHASLYQYGSPSQFSSQSYNTYLVGPVISVTT